MYIMYIYIFLCLSRSPHRDEVLYMLLWAIITGLPRLKSCHDIRCNCSRFKGPFDVYVLYLHAASQRHDSWESLAIHLDSVQMRVWSVFSTRRTDMVQCGWFDTAMSQKPGNPGPLSILKSQLVYGYLFPSDMVIRGFHPSPFQKSAAHWSPTVPAGWHAPGARGRKQWPSTVATCCYLSNGILMVINGTLMMINDIY